MALYNKLNALRMRSGTSYIRFLLGCAIGFAVVSLLLFILGYLVFEPYHESMEARNVEATVAWIGGALSMAVSFVFSALSLLQYQRIKKMKELAHILLVDGQENTLYQVVHEKHNADVASPVTQPNYQALENEPTTGERSKI